MKIKQPYLSIIIPVYNETKRIQNLSQIINFVKKLTFTTELMVVNDGSADQTLKKIKSFQKFFKFVLISYAKNMGKGYALKQGMLAAKGKFILFSDIDLSTPIEEFSKFKKHLKKYHVLIGTRKNKSSLLLKRQPALREFLGKGFTALSRMVLNLDVSDFTCGFKCFSQKAAKEIFPSIKNYRWGFDSEALFIANQKGFKIKEIPVKWVNDQQTKVKFPQDIVISLTELLKIRFRKY